MQEYSTKLEDVLSYIKKNREGALGGTHTGVYLPFGFETQLILEYKPLTDEVVAVFIRGGKWGDKTHPWLKVNQDAMFKQLIENLTPRKSLLVPEDYSLYYVFHTVKSGKGYVLAGDEDAAEAKMDPFYYIYNVETYGKGELLNSVDGESVRVIPPRMWKDCRWLPRTGMRVYNAYDMSNVKLYFKNASSVLLNAVSGNNLLGYIAGTVGGSSRATLWVPKNLFLLQRKKAWLLVKSPKNKNDYV